MQEVFINHSFTFTPRIKDSSSFRKALCIIGRREERKGGKAWILRKKEQMERKGKVVKASSKYTGRKRGPKF